MKAAIVGGGVGGLAAAIALGRAGIEVEVFEQAAAIEPVGASLSLGPNAVRLLEGLGERLRRVGAVPDTVDLLRWDDGALLHRTTLGPPMEERFGAPQLDFFRPDLQRVLLEALTTASGVLRLGCEVVAIEQDDAVATVVLGGGDRVAADVVVAADGVRSPIRQQLVGAESPVFSGTVVYRGVARREDVADLHPPRQNLYWLGPQRHGVSYWLSHGELLAVTLATREAEWSRESWTLEAPVAEALAFVDGWDEPFRERIRRCPVMLRSAVFIREPIEHWSFGRITLLGDAAHAMEPFQAQGAAQAVEDAHVLAACLGDGAGEGDPAGALRRYERIRLARAAELQGSARAAAESFYLPDGEEQRARDAAYAVLRESQPWGPRERLWDYDVREALAAGTS
jgi:salicylate hydroxylase